MASCLKTATQVQHVTKLILKAKSDSERFAVLLLITKTLKVESLSGDERLKLIKNIGMNFIIRLLETSVKKISENANEEKLAFASVAVSILACFNLEIEKDNRLIIFPLVMKVLKKCIAGNFENFSVNEANLLEDSFCLTLSFLAKLKLLAVEDNQVLQFIEELVYVSSTGCLLTDNKHFQDSSFKALKRTLEIIGTLNTLEWEKIMEYLLNLFEKLSHILKTNFSEQTFYLMKNFGEIVELIPKVHCLNLLSESWKNIVAESLRNCLSSKLLVHQRHTALIFSYSIISKWGFEFFIQSSSAALKDKNFIQLLIRLATVEARLWLDINFECSNISDTDMVTITAWCGIIEESCSKIVKFENERDDIVSFFTFDDIQKIQPAMDDVMKINGKFITNRLNSDSHQEQVIILHALIKLLSAWLCVENHVYSATGLDLIDNVIEILLYIEKNKLFYLLKFILSPAMLYIEDITSFDKLLKGSFLSILHRLYIGICSKKQGCNNELELIMQCVFGVQVMIKNQPNFFNDEFYKEVQAFYEDAHKISGDSISTTDQWYINLMVILLYNIQTQSGKEIHGIHLTSTVKKLTDYILLKWPAELNTL